MQRASRTPAALALLSALLVLGGAALFFGVVKDCGTPAQSGVHFTFTPGDLRGAERVTACVEGRCRRVENPGTSRGITVPATADGPRRVRTQLIVQRPGGATQLQTLDADLRRTEPDGKHCGTWWTARVDLGGPPGAGRAVSAPSS